MISYSYLKWIYTALFQRPQICSKKKASQNLLGHTPDSLHRAWNSVCIATTLLSPSTRSVFKNLKNTCFMFLWIEFNSNVQIVKLWIKVVQV
jgi:hypothetical protein